MDKGEVARRQLGTALDLFLRGHDPVSVHTLAMAGGEIAERLAEKAGAETLISHIRATFPDMEEKDLRNIQRKYYNAFKHAAKINGQYRNDDSVLENFNPQSNDHVLYHGWHDLTVSGLPIPIEAQVFEFWYFAKYSEKVNPEVDISVATNLFPSLPSCSLQRQRSALIDAIRKAKKNGSVMADPATDKRPLMLPWD